MQHCTDDLCSISQRWHSSPISGLALQSTRCAVTLSCDAARQCRFALFSHYGYPVPQMTKSVEITLSDERSTPRLCRTRHLKSEGVPTCAMTEQHPPNQASAATSCSRGPLVWAVLALFHPMPTDDSPYEGINDDVDLWLVVHVGQLILTPFLFLAVWRLLDGLSSRASTISRCALVVWTVFFSAYDSVQGVATGILTKHANDLAGQEQAAVAEAIDYIVNDNALAGNVSFLAVVAGAAWLTVAIAAAVALNQAGAGRAIVIAAAVSTVFAAHAKPAAIGLLALTVAGVLRERQRAKPHVAIHAS